MDQSARTAIAGPAAGPPTAPRLLLLGASTRALAASALLGSLARERFPGGLIAVDYFGDTDLDREARGAWPVTVLSVSRDLGWPRTTAGLGGAALALSWSRFACAGGLENRPGLIRLLARRGAHLGSVAGAISAVRNPARLFPCLARHRVPHAGWRPGDRAPRDGGEWLFKRRRSAGGGGVRLAPPGEGRRAGEYLQEFVRGTAGSAVVLLAAGRARLLGTTEQIGAAPWLGAAPFRYAGNLAGPPGALLSPSAEAALGRAAAVLARRFGLLGLNGLDFVIDGGAPRLIEVNPRWTASMELFEDPDGPALFDLHLGALEGRLETAAFAATRPAYRAKGILYATTPVEAPDPADLEAIGARDRPRAGEVFLTGQPICTLFATGESRRACLAALRARAAEARRLLRPAPPGPGPAAANVVSCARSTTDPRRG